MKKTLFIALILIVIVLIVLGYANKKVAVDDNTIRIGVLASLSGNAAYYGNQTQKGIEVGEDWLRENYPNIRFEIFTEDNKFNPKAGIDAYNKLKVEKNIDAVIAHTSPVAVAVAPLAIKDSKPIMAVSASANAYSTPDDLSFRTTSGTSIEVLPMISYIKNNFKSVSILYMNNEIGSSISTSLRSGINNSDVKIATDSGYAVDTNDFRTLVLKAIEQKSEAIYVAGLASHISNVLKQLKELNSNIPVLSFRTAEDQTLIKNSGSLANNVVFTSAFDPSSDNPEMIEFNRAYVDKWKEIPDSYAAESYEGIRLLGSAYSKCGKDSLCIKDYLSGLRNYQSIFGPLNVDNKGDVAYTFFLKTVRNGEFVRLGE